MEFTRCFRCMERTGGYPCAHCGYDPDARGTKEYVLRLGTILNGRYVVGTILGQGGFGITYVGWDLVLESKVAVKEYFPSGQVGRSAGGALQWYSTPQAETARSSGKEMFLKEARKMSRVREIPQVVHIRDMFQQNDTAYIVMDFVEGQTLMARLKKNGPLSWEQAQSIFLPAIRAMEQVHQEGLIHRDLSPDNLMLRPDGSIKILDLGAAKDLNINSGASSMQVAKGGFSPLEQYTQRGGSGAWSDVYAMAATMYYSLTGVLPPNAVDRLEDDQIRWDLPGLAELPPKAVAAMQQAMAVSAKARTQTMGEFLAQLEKAQTKRKPTPKQKAKKKKSPLPVLAAVLAVALIAGWVLWPKQEAKPQLESRPQAEAPTETETVSETETTIPTEPDGIFPLSIPKRDTTFPLTMQERTIAAGGDHTVAVKQDGSVVAVGGNSYGQLHISDWNDIVSVDAGGEHTIGLKSDGTAVGKGYNNNGQVAVSGWPWQDLAAVCALPYGTLGLKSDGTVVGAERYGTFLSTDIVAISGTYGCMVGLRADGTLETKAYYSPHPDVHGWTDIVAISCGSDHVVGLKADGTVVAAGDNFRGQCDVSGWENIVAISAGGCHTVGLKADGTVVATGPNDDGRCDVSDWTDIVAISAGSCHTVGLKADGTMVATGDNTYGQCDVSGWTDIRIPGGVSGSTAPEPTETPTATVPETEPEDAPVLAWPYKTFSAGRRHTVAVRNDGTVVARGYTGNGQCDVQDWRDIVSISAGGLHTVGLQSDGSAIAVGYNDDGQCNVSGWTDLVSVSAGHHHTVGLKADGTVVAVGANNYNQCDVSDWTDIIAISAGWDHTVGLKANGSVVATGDYIKVESWNDIVDISSGYNFTVGLKADGTVVFSGRNQKGQGDVSGWKEIAAIAAGYEYTIGLKSDGTVVGTGSGCGPGALRDSGSLEDILSIAAGSGHIVAMKKDDAMISLGDNDLGQCDVSGWTDIRIPGSIQ